MNICIEVHICTQDRIHIQLRICKISNQQSRSYRFPLVKQLAYFLGSMNKSIHNLFHIDILRYIYILHMVGTLDNIYSQIRSCNRFDICKNLSRKGNDLGRFSLPQLIQVYDVDYDLDSKLNVVRFPIFYPINELTLHDKSLLTKVFRLIICEQFRISKRGRMKARPTFALWVSHDACNQSTT